MFAFAGTAVSGTLFGSTAEPGSVVLFRALTALYARFGATGDYTYTPELYPPENRATGMGSHPAGAASAPSRCY